MTRLTNSARESIALVAVAHSFDPKAEALAVTENDLAREAYASLIPDAERAIVEALPQGWVRRDECLRFNAAGYSVRLRTTGEALPVPYRPRGSDHGGYGCNEIGTIPHGDLADRIQAHAQAVEDMRVARRRAYNATLKMLSTVSTVKRLREAWPEGALFYSAYENDNTAVALPAVRVDEVNAMLGIAA